MSHRAVALTVLSLAAVVVIAACQDYNFNPLGACLIQPGSKPAKFIGQATSDILFVIDESGSMAGEQQNLADNFNAFILTLAKENQNRVNVLHVEPLEFHIAITTSSIFTKGSTPDTYSDTYAACSDSRNGTKYPKGDFVVAPGSPNNPKVIHFTKELPWSSWDVVANPNTPPVAIQTLIDQFKANIQRGTCGSNEEQHIQAARLAIQKALAGTQTAPAGEWPHPNAKMVVVIIGDEDDCGSPDDPTTGLDNANCNQLGSDPAHGPGNPGTFPIKEYADYFTGLGRPFGAAFIVSARISSSVNNCDISDLGASCVADVCCAPWCPGAGTCNDNNCGGRNAGYRHVALANELRGRIGTDNVLVGSICDQSFANTLQKIAEIAKPPDSVVLDSMPASSDITSVRIVDANGNQVKTCDFLAPPFTTSTAGWWFVTDLNPTGQVPNCDASSAVSSTPTRCIHINHASGNCEVNPGQSYLAEYLGRIPQDGCQTASATKPVRGSPTAGQQACAQALGGSADDWWCYAQTGTIGTCICNKGG